MSDDRRRFGQDSEALAAELLRQKGYEIVTQNWRTGTGEIDIIARDRETLVFVEVKARRTRTFGNPKYAISHKKQQKLSLTALGYLKTTSQLGSKARFDVVTLVFAGGSPEIEIVRNAFEFSCM
ncbi:MAG: YraN family protein [Desulfobacterales bacterium]